MQKARLSIIAAVVSIAIGLILTSTLGLDKARLALDDLQTSRANAVALVLRDALAEAVSSGRTLADLEHGQSVVEQVAGRDHALTGLAVFDNSWRPLFHAGEPGARPDARHLGHKERSAALAPLVVIEAEWFDVYAPILESNGHVDGWVGARYPASLVDRHLVEIRSVLMILTVFLVGVVAIVGYVVARRESATAQRGVRDNEAPATVTSRLSVVLMIATPLAMAILLASIFVMFDRNLIAAAQDKAQVLVGLAGDELAGDYDLGFTVRGLPGAKSLLEMIVTEQPEIGGFRLTVLARNQRIEAGVRGGRPLAEAFFDLPDEGASHLSLLADGGYVFDHIRAILIDLLVVLFVAVFATREVLRFGLSSARPRAPPNNGVRVGAAEDVRFPVFLFFLGIELSRSFFPLFVADLYEPGLPVSRQIAIALPMSAWVLAVALATPFAGYMTRRWGIRHTLIAGMMPAVVGLCLTATADNLWELIVWRCLTAGGFGLVTVAAILYTATHSQQGARTRSIGIFVAASVAASVCAASIGGILADSIGERATFFVAAAIVALAILVTRANVHDGASLTTGQHPRRGWAAVLRDPVFLFFMVLAAVPSRVVLTGLFYLLVPLTLSDLGYDHSGVGRVMMLFFVTMVVLIPTTGRLADEANAHRSVILSGAFAAAGGAGLLVLGQALAGGAQHLFLALAIIALGAAQCTGRAPMIAYLSVGFPESAARFGPANMVVAFRLVERVGSVSGPLVAAALSQVFGHQGAAGVLAIWLFASALGLGLLFLSGKDDPGLV